MVWLLYNGFSVVENWNKSEEKEEKDRKENGSEEYRERERVILIPLIYKKDSLKYLWWMSHERDLTRFEYCWSLWFAKSDSSKGVDKWTLVANGKRVFSSCIFIHVKTFNIVCFTNEFKLKRRSSLIWEWSLLRILVEVLLYRCYGLIIASVEALF